LKIVSLHRVEFRLNLKNAADILVLYFAPWPDNVWGKNFNLRPWGIKLHRISVCHQFWAWKSGMTESLAYFNEFRKLSSPYKQFKCLKSAFLEVFRSEPSNPHGRGTCLKILSDNVINLYKIEVLSRANIYSRNENIISCLIATHLIPMAL